MIPYEQFRTGMTFADVSEILHAEASAKYRRGEYMFISRSTVLGRWRQYKLEMYERLKRAYEERNV